MVLPIVQHGPFAGRPTFRPPEIAKLEEKLGMKLADLTFRQVFTDPRFEEIRKDETLFTTLTGQKVLDTIIHGAEYSKGDRAVWRDASRFVEMDDVIVDLPKDTMMDYTSVKHGVGAVTESETPPTYTRLDVSDGSKTHRCAPFVDKNTVKDQKWNVVEDLLWQAGEALGDHANYDYVLAFDTASTSDWATDVWVSFVNGLKTGKTAKFFPDTMIVGAAGEALLLQDSRFITSTILDREGRIVKSGQIGRILYVDVFYCRHIDSLPTEGGKTIWGVLSERQKAVAFGLRDALNVQDVDDPRKWIEGAVAEMRFDVQLQNVNAGVQLKAA